MPPQMRTEALDRGRQSPTRERILAAASDLFSRLGFDATTVKDIARECQLSDPALYYHFPSKRDILAALLESSPLDEIQLESSVTPTREALVDDLVRVFDFWSARSDLLRLLYGHALDEDAPTRTLAEEVATTYERLILPVLSEIYGGNAQRIHGVLITLLVGVQLDALIEFGAQYESRVTSPEFRARLRRLMSEALPQPESLPEAV